MFSWRHLTCVFMLAIIPVSLSAQETAGAMLRSNGTDIFVNGSRVPASRALFRNDLVETPKNAAGRIEASGSTVDINAETMVQFEGDEMVLDHGTLTVNTSHGWRVRVGCVTVTPVNPTEWAHFEVADVDGKVRVSAQKSDVYIDARSKNPQSAKQTSHSSRETVREGEQKSREESCGAASRPYGAGAQPDAILNSPWAIAAGAGAVGLITCWALCRSDNPVSPDHP